MNQKTDLTPNHKLVSLFRQLCLLAGGMLILISFLAEERSYFLIACGLASIAAALPGIKIFHRYKETSTILLSTLLLFVGLEAGATAIFSLSTSRLVKNFLAEQLGRPNDIVAHHYNKLSYYAHQDWAARYWREHKAALKKKYYPYVLWRSPAFTGETLNINEEGIRITPGASCSPDAYTLFVFGGSAMWGWGAPDWGTIPAYLQAALDELHDGPVCVINYGEQAYVSAQSLIQLIITLESGEEPDLVIFYDGVNEVLAAHQTGKPLIHQNFSQISALFENDQPVLVRGFQSLNVNRILQMILANTGMQRERNRTSSLPEENEALAGAVVQTYLNTYTSVQALSQAFHFDFLFFWQPHILTGDKNLTAEEQKIITDLDWVVPMDSTLTQLFSDIYDQVALEAASYENLHSLSHVFDTTRTSVWNDTWGHVTPEGNRLIAEKMVTFIK